MNKITQLSIALTLGLCSSVNVSAQVDAYPIEKHEAHDDYQLVNVATGIAIPWGMVWLNDTDLLVTDRSGELRMIRNDTLLEQVITGVPKVDARGQGGLLDIEKDPNYETNGWLYLAYSGFEGDAKGSNTSVVRAKLDKSSMSLTDVEVIFDGSPNTSNPRHFGSRLEFGSDGHLYISVGDRGERSEYPQRLDADAGKIHRINPDGSIPKDNPFVGKKDHNDTIYSYGHRNPQGMARHPKTGDIWTHEHGPRGGDEINRVKAGVNYGWPVISYGINYSGTSFTDITSKEGMEQPDWQWTPSIAPSGMVFVTGDQYPEFKGHMLVGALKFAHGVLVEMKDDKVVAHYKLFEGAGRIRSLSTSPDGTIYLGVDGSGIFKVVPNS